MWKSSIPRAFTLGGEGGPFLGDDEMIRQAHLPLAINLGPQLQALPAIT